MATHSNILAWRIPWTAAYQAPLPMGFSRQEYWSGVPSPSPVVCGDLNKKGIEKGRDICVCVADSHLCTVETEITL